jgi:hypothetical protein
MISQVFAWLTVLLFVGVFFFGFLASRNVDTNKIGELPRSQMRILGPLVSEKVLTESGKRWALMRNLCLVSLGVSLLMFIFYKQLWGAA